MTATVPELAEDVPPVPIDATRVDVPQATSKEAAHVARERHSLCWPSSSRSCLWESSSMFSRLVERRAPTTPRFRRTSSSYRLA